MTMNIEQLPSDKSKLIAVDVDLTVCAIDELWLNWLQHITGTDFNPLGLEGELDYNMSNYFSEGLQKAGVDGLDFFRSESAYDYAKPVKGSVEALRTLHEMGYKIVFVSAVKGNHHSSKFRWLKRNFPFMAGFVATKEKWLIPCDIFIDDRNNFLNMVPAKTKIKKLTAYKQDTELTCRVMVCEEWENILEYIKITEKHSWTLNGGGQPIDDDVQVDVVLVSGDTSSGSAREYWWPPENDDCDIVKWRLHSEN